MNEVVELKQWLKPKEVNSLYGISVSTLAKWRMDKKNIAFFKSGKFIKYNNCLFIVKVLLTLLLSAKPLY